MNYNIALVIWLAIVYVLIQYTDVYQIEEVAGVKCKRIRFEVAFLIMVPAIVLAGMRSFNYADTSAYVPAFRAMPSTIAGIPEYMSTITKDKGFSLFACLIKTFITENPRIYLIIIAIIQGTVIVLLFRKYSNDYILSIFLFIASTDYLSWMYNGMRQFMAAMLIYAATNFMLQRKYMKAILVILFASTIHQSALIMIPIMFIMQGKAWNTKTLLVIIGCMFALQYIDQFTNILETALSDTQYTNVVSDWESWSDDGTNIIRVLVYSMPAIVSFVGKRYIKAANNQVINMVTNASIISAGIYIVSSATSGIFIGRLPIYVSLYGYIFLPWAIENYFEKNSQVLIRITVIVCYLAFYAYSIVNGMGVGAW